MYDFQPFVYQDDQNSMYHFFFLLSYIHTYIRTFYQYYHCFITGSSWEYYKSQIVHILEYHKSKFLSVLTNYVLSGVKRHRTVKQGQGFLKLGPDLLCSNKILQIEECRK